MPAKEKTPNYTEEMVAKVHNMYAELGNAGLEQIAEAVGKNVRSVRARLVRDKLYVAPEKGAPKAKDEGPTKKELVNTLESVAPADFPNVEGIQGANKEVIAWLVAHFSPTDTDDADVSVASEDTAPEAA